MTVTESETTVTGTFVVAAPILRDALATAVIATGRDMTVPVLTGVLIEWADGGTVHVVATDRWRLITVDTGITGAGSGRVLVAREHVDALVKALPKGGRRVPVSSVTVAVTGDGLTVRCDTPGEASWSRTVPVMDGTFPKWATLIPSGEQLDGAEPVQSMGWNPDLMASFAKAPVIGRGARGLVWRFQGPNRPMVATIESEDHKGMTATFLLMPVRQGSR